MPDFTPNDYPYKVRFDETMDPIFIANTIKDLNSLQPMINDFEGKASIRKDEKLRGEEGVCKGSEFLVRNDQKFRKQDSDLSDGQDGLLAVIKYSDNEGNVDEENQAEEILIQDRSVKD